MKNQTFSVIFESGQVATLEGKSMLEVVSAHPNISKIERIDKVSLTKRVKALNRDLSSFSYLGLAEIDSIFQKLLEGHGFAYNVEAFFEVGRTSEGRLNIDIGGAYLTLTWYQMQSGKFEIVSYAS